MSRDDVELELCLRAAQRFGVERATVPFDFPLGVADHLRAGGIALELDPEAFVTRRRAKTDAEIAGIRRAQAAADEAMGIAARMIHERAGVTSEEVRAAMQQACDARGCDLPDDVIVSHGPQGAIGHEAGHGEVGAGEPVIVDIWPRDRESRCWADMTRTFVGGGADPAPEIAEWWRLTREALEKSYGAVRAGADGREIYGASCEPFEQAGILTQRSKPAGEKLEEGYYHSLGHGVGLEVHERPNLGRTPDALIAGDVITLEPGCYRKDLGGVRLEDLVIVTDDGAELLTNFPYEL
jgi:Xaa-Pro aminopeptidase